MIELKDYQFEIGGVVFGIGSPISVEAEGFDPGVNEFTVQDVANAYNDSLSFGRDYVTPSVWAWQAFTTADDEAAALAAVRELASVWNDRELRRTPGAVTALRYRINGRTRTIFGRPRPLGQVMTNKLLHGEVPLSLEFQPVDILHYGDEVQTFNVKGQPSSVAGFTTPIVTPLTTIAGTPTTDSLPTFGGDEPAPFEAVFTGPATNPKLYTDEWELQLMTTIAENRSITVSTYPWGARAVRDDGVRLPGILSVKSRPSQARLDPAGQQVRFSAIDSTNTADVTIRWRQAYTTI